MTAATTPKPTPALASLRRALLGSTAIDAIAVGARLINLALRPVAAPSAPNS